MDGARRNPAGRASFPPSDDHRPSLTSRTTDRAWGSQQLIPDVSQAPAAASNPPPTSSCEHLGPRLRPPGAPPAQTTPHILSRPGSACSDTSSTTLVSSQPSPSFNSSPSSMAERYKELDHGPSDFPTRYAHAYGRRPLIDLVTNDWQRDHKYTKDDLYSPTGSDSFYFEKESSSRLRDCMSSFSAHRRIPRRVQRYLVIYLTLLITFFVAWKWWLRPGWEERKLFNDSFERASENKNIFGTNMRPDFADMIQVKTLDSTLLPTPDSEGRRLVIVGDVHGMKDSLVSLLDKVSFRSSRDHLILTGDIIAKGPESPAVIDLAKSLYASCVRGNHEDRVLLAHADMHAHHAPLPGPDEDSDQKEDNLSEESFSHGDYADRALAKQFSAAQIEWLKQCPVILRVGGIAGMGEVAVVHAGLVPGVPYERQDPFQVMNMRTIDLETRLPSEEREGIPWEKLWNDHQKRLPAKERMTVIYGHDSKRGLNIKNYSKGLDSGCVRGGKLTALVIEAKKDGKGVKQTLVSVKCKNQEQKKVEENKA